MIIAGFPDRRSGQYLSPIEVWHTCPGRLIGAPSMPTRVFCCRDAESRFLLLSVFALVLSGCSGGNGSPPQNPISVYLPISTINLPAGANATVPIQIASPSETAQVAFSGLPAGVQVRYAATDTNPSGTLTFEATESATTGTFMPTVTVTSSGLTESATFTLVVKAS